MSFSYATIAKQEGKLPRWCSDVDDLATSLLHSSSSSRQRALVKGILQMKSGSISNLQTWGCERVERAVTYYRKVRLRNYVRTELPDFTNSLVVLSFGARDGGFQLSQDIRRWIIDYTSLHEEDVYHDYASLVGHPLSKVVVGDDGISRQLNENWNIYFSNALAAAPVMIFIVSEAWTQSAWCALEHRQRGELKVAKQAPGYEKGNSTYENSSHSNPDDAAYVSPLLTPADGDDGKRTAEEEEEEEEQTKGITADAALAAAASYLDRHIEMSLQLEKIRASWQPQSFDETTESVYRAVAFGSKKNELFIFVDHDSSLCTEEEGDKEGGVVNSASDAVRRVHDSVPENQRFYHTPSMSSDEKAIELHALCVRMTEVIEEQAYVEAMGSGKEMNRRLFEGLNGEDDLVGNSSSGASESSSPMQMCSSLLGLRELAAAENDRQKEEKKAQMEERLKSGRDNAIQRGLLFDTGPCPF